MNFQRGRGKEPLEINLVPLIDVMMVILIFLMIHHHLFQVHRAADQPADRGCRKAARARQRDHGAGQRAGAIRDQPQSDPFPRRRAAGRGTEARRRTLKAPLVVISADAAATHQAVVRVMEASRLAGLTQLTFTTQSAK